MNTLFEQNNLYYGTKLETYTVQTLRNELHSIIRSRFNDPIFIKAIISSTPKLYPQFVFFDIKDETKNMQLTVLANKGVFNKVQSKLKKLGVVNNLDKDIPVMLVCECKVSTQKNINFRLSLVDIIPEYTSQILQNKLDQTISKLKDENLLNKQKELPFPCFAKNIAILSSDQGTSLKDILSSIGEYKKFFNTFFVSVRVEGNNAVNNIVNAINYLNKNKVVDLIIIARGGGSSADLSVFNDYKLCKTVCLSKIPIITAIGHETDLHAIELCSNYTPSPSTPSGIGSFINNYYKNLIGDLHNTMYEISSIINNAFFKEFIFINKTLNEVKHIINNVINVKIINLSNTITNIKNKISVKNIINLNINEILNILKNYKTYTKKELSNVEQILNNNMNIINSLNPKNLLKKGYTFVTDLNKKLIKDKNNVKESMELNFYNGIVKVKPCKNVEEKND